jgi:hypothetical protein
MKQMTMGIVACILAMPSIASAWGIDMKKEELAAVGKHCVHGYYVNETSVVFFQGNAVQLNDDLSKLKDARLASRKLVIHPGTQRAKSPWDKQVRDTFADWSVMTYDDPADAAKAVPRVRLQIDVWLGNKIDLSELRVPEGIEVQSGGEIERFVQRNKHKSK